MFLAYLLKTGCITLENLRHAYEKMEAYSFNRHIVSTHSVPSTVLSPEEIESSAGPHSLMEEADL